MAAVWAVLLGCLACVVRVLPLLLWAAKVGFLGLKWCFICKVQTKIIVYKSVYVYCAVLQSFRRVVVGCVVMWVVLRWGFGRGFLGAFSCDFFRILFFLI